MRITVNGTRLWFDVDGCALTPEGRAMRRRPTVLLVHGGPGSYDHSYLRPHFDQLTAHAQVVYLDLRDHGRSSRHNPAQWSLEACADDLRAVCDALDIERPVVLGHSLGGFVAMLYGSRHPNHARALILQSTMARFDLDRLVEGFRATAGDEVAELARRDYDGDTVTDAEWQRVYAAFGPEVPGEDELARRVQNPQVADAGMRLLRALNLVTELPRITSPTLVCTGDRDPVTPPACAREILDALPAGLGQLAVVDGAGHFPWLDRPDTYWPLLTAFLREMSPVQA